MTEPHDQPDQRANGFFARLRRYLWVPGFCRSCGRSIRSRSKPCPHCGEMRP